MEIFCKNVSIDTERKTHFEQRFGYVIASTRSIFINEISSKLSVLPIILNSRSKLDLLTCKISLHSQKVA